MTTEQAIKQHGAAKVYRAAYEAMKNNRQPLLDMGFPTATAGVAYLIMRDAFNAMSEAERAIDKAQVESLL